MDRPIVDAPGAGTYQLDAALLVYSSKQGNYISVHDAIQRDGQPSLGAGRPATKAGIAELIKKCAGQVGIHAWITDEVVYVSTNLLVWWRPSSAETVFFSQLKHADGTLGRAQGVAMQPPMVFAVDVEGNWYAWALRHNKRPAAHTELMNAPHFNINAQGLICTGNVKLPSNIGPETIPAFERAFFQSRFTHPSHNNLLDGDIHALWLELTTDGNIDFPVQKLVSADFTLGQAVQEIDPHVDDQDTPQLQIQEDEDDEDAA